MEDERAKVLTVLGRLASSSEFVKIGRDLKPHLAASTNIVCTAQKDEGTTPNRGYDPCCVAS